MPPHPRSLRFPKALWPIATLLTAVAFLPSCAYVQTHKNVKELGRSYQGHKLEKPRHLYRSGNQWYLAAHPASYRLSHDFVHDNVFRKTNEPEMVLLKEEPQLAYHTISNATATVLLRQDGYADTEILARELTDSTIPWTNTLPRMQTHDIRAQIDGQNQASITHEPTPVDVPIAYQFLSGLDFLLIDVPGTVIYNTAVPVIAPFVFFYEFLSE